MENVTTETRPGTIRTGWNDDQKPVEVEIGNTAMVAMPRQFSTGSLGWYASGKGAVTLAGGRIIPVQIAVTVTAIGSKAW